MESNLCVFLSLGFYCSCKLSSKSEPGNTALWPQHWYLQPLHLLDLWSYQCHWCDKIRWPINWSGSKRRARQTSSHCGEPRERVRYRSCRRRLSPLMPSPSSLPQLTTLLNVSHVLGPAFSYAFSDFTAQSSFIGLVLNPTLTPGTFHRHIFCVALLFLTSFIPQPDMVFPLLESQGSLCVSLLMFIPFQSHSYY